MSVVRRPSRSTAPLAAAVLAALFLAASNAARPAAQEQPAPLIRPIGPGASLLTWTRPDGPHALYAVELDSSHPFLRLGVSLGGGDRLDLEPLPDQAVRLSRPDRYAIAGVNGDFFLYPAIQNPGLPTNAAVEDGELVRSPSARACLVLRAGGGAEVQTLRLQGGVTLPDGSLLPVDLVNYPRTRGQVTLFTPRFGRSTRTTLPGVEVVLEPEGFPLRNGRETAVAVREVRQGGNTPIPDRGWVLSAAGPPAERLAGLTPGAALKVRLELDPPIAVGDQVLGGGPRLLRNGEPALEPGGLQPDEPFAAARHPRTAVGIAGNRVVLLASDGRQPGHSIGMTLLEVAEELKRLGCREAINLDGGGSTTVWVRGRVVNRPSDGRVRPVANGLLLFSTAPVGPPARLTADPPEVRALPGAVVPLRVGAEDEHCNPVPLPGPVRWAVPEGFGEVRGDRLHLAAGRTEAVSGEVVAHSGDLEGVLRVHVEPAPARVEGVPGRLRVAVGGTARPRVEARDGAGRLLLTEGAVTWQGDGDGVRIEPDGSVTGLREGDYRLTARVAGRTAEVGLRVGPPRYRVLDGFETPGAWSFSASPAGTPGSLTYSSERPRTGRSRLRLEYDFSRAGGTRAVYALGRFDLGLAGGLRVWVWGDGNGGWLRVRLRDSSGAAHLLDLSRRVDWRDEWRPLTVSFPSTLRGPLTLEAVYLVETDTRRRFSGVIGLDDLEVMD